MHRFYLPPEACAEPTLMLEDREAYHALRVLRVGRGDRVAVLDGAGQTLLCEVEETAKDHLVCSVLERQRAPKPGWSLTLLQAIPKGKRIEDIIEKATELGVSRIVPLMTERCLVQMDPDEAEEKREKWQHVAVEAIKQCGQPWLPMVEAPIALLEYLENPEPFDLPLVGSLHGGSRHPRVYFKEFVARHGRAPASLAAWIGPEGDFSPTEMQVIRGAGALPVTFGSLVLRVETAAIYALGLINYEMQSAVAD